MREHLLERFPVFAGLAPKFLERLLGEARENREAPK
jgi:hypothetical protein